MPVAGTRRLAAIERIARMRMQHAQRSVEQRDFDGLALARFLAFVQGKQHAYDGIHPGGGVHQRNADTHGIESRITVD